MSDDEWWYTIAPFLETLDFSPYPVANRVGPVVGELYGLGDPDRAFQFGLERLLDGLGVLVAGKGMLRASWMNVPTMGVRPMQAPKAAQLY